MLSVNGTTTYGEYKKQRVDKVWKSQLSRSIGLLYTAFTEFLGFEVNEENTK